MGELLQRCLASVAAQSPPCIAALLLSWSSSDEFRPEVEAMLDRARVADGMPKLVTVRQESKCSQFQHFLSLIRLPEVSSADWLLFSDDDDIWHPRRCMLFARDTLQAEATTHAVWATARARPTSLAQMLAAD